MFIKRFHVWKKKKKNQIFFFGVISKFTAFRCTADVPSSVYGKINIYICPLNKTQKGVCTLLF